MFGTMRTRLSQATEDASKYLNNRLPDGLNKPWVVKGAAAIASPVVGIAQLVPKEAREAIGGLKLDEPDVKVTLKGIENYGDFQYAELPKGKQYTFREDSNNSFTLNYQGKNRAETFTLTRLHDNDGNLVTTPHGDVLYRLASSDETKLKDLSFEPKNATKDGNLIVVISGKDKEGNSQVQTWNKGPVQRNTVKEHNPHLWLLKSKDGKSSRPFASALMFPLNVTGEALGFAGSIAGGVVDSTGKLCNWASDRLNPALDGKINPDAGEAEPEAAALPQWAKTRTVAGAALGFTGATLKTTAMGIHGVCQMTKSALMGVPRGLSAVLNRNTFDLKLAWESLKQTTVESVKAVTKEAQAFPEVIKTANERMEKIADLRKDIAIHKEQDVSSSKTTEDKKPQQQPDVLQKTKPEVPTKPVGPQGTPATRAASAARTEALSNKPQRGETAQPPGQHYKPTSHVEREEARRSGKTGPDTSPSQ